jgi:hypothetical protein
MGQARAVSPRYLSLTSSRSRTPQTRRHPPSPPSIRPLPTRPPPSPSSPHPPSPPRNPPTLPPSLPPSHHPPPSHPPPTSHPPTLPPHHLPLPPHPPLPSHSAEFFITYFVYFPAMAYGARTGFFAGSNAVWRTDTLRRRPFAKGMQTEDIDMCATTRTTARTYPHLPSHALTYPHLPSHALTYPHLPSHTHTSALQCELVPSSAR